MSELTIARKVFNHIPEVAGKENNQSTKQTASPTAHRTSAKASIRYAQCWEDADILLEALQVRPGEVCLSIASGGENSLSLLSKSPSKVIALDCNPSQLALLELKVAAFRNLSHPELLKLLGAVESTAAERRWLYGRCEHSLKPTTRRFWRLHMRLVEEGVNGSGKFENYFRLFRNLLLPLIHDSQTVEQLCAERSPAERRAFYLNVWNTWRWKAMFSIFFSKTVMGNAGRDPQLFKFVEGSVASRILNRVEHGLTAVDPHTNPYLRWILTGKHNDVLPHALRAENFEIIRANLDRLQWHCLTVGEYLNQPDSPPIDCFNLSDIFEYMDQPTYELLLETLIASSNHGARLAYWNMLVDRHAPDTFIKTGKLRSHERAGAELLAADKAFFYSNFVLEEVQHR